MSQDSKATGAGGNHAGVPLPLRYRPGRRLPQLYVGLVAYGISMALIVAANLGSMPWDVLHQGVGQKTGLTFGIVSILFGAVVLLLWIPLRQRPGLGTISNVFVVGLAADTAFTLLPTPDPLAVRIGYLVAGILLNAFATALYIGARFGPGPRDGLMTGIAARGHSIRLVRTSIEILVVASGWLLGGTLGLGTIAYALAVGPLVQIILPRVTVPPPAPALAPGIATAPA
jgi:uncharacterized membrane protein YczE